MTRPRGLKRPAWGMAMLGLLGLLACLGPAAFVIASDWLETRQMAQRGGDSLAASVATQLSRTLEQGRSVLPQLMHLLAKGNISSTALANVLPDGSAWVAVYGASGKPVLVSAVAGQGRPPTLPLSFVRQADGEVMALLSEPSADRSQLMVVALPVPVLRTTSASTLTIETTAGDILFSDGARQSTVSTPQTDVLSSLQPVPGQPLRVFVGTETHQLMEPWRQRALRAGGAALVATLLVGPVLLILARRLARDTRDSAALQAANRELSRSNADLEQFAYVASHDLKEPLRNIASYVQLLQRRYQGKLDEDADAFIGYTVDGVRRLQMIINELLAYSRIGTGPLQQSPVQTGAVLSSVLGSLKAAIAEAGAVVDVRGPLPVVMGDAGQLTSVFQNLLANALKYRRDDVRAEVKVSVAEMGGSWCFSVADNGIGIDPLYQTQIFELFKRLHARDRYGGSGIGLAVCQRVVERHGGSIWVDSIPGQGACFHFTLPKMG